MRSLVAIAFGLSIPIAIGAFVACGPPSSFDRITGVPPDAEPPDATNTLLIDDPTLPPPRPIAPLSGTFRNGGKPKLQWELASPAIGARIRLCRGAPECDDAAAKTFVATGRDYTVQEDLEPGLWFWTLTSRTASAQGTLRSKPWSLLVRGGNPGGTPPGSLLDANGDGKVDLFVIVELTEDTVVTRFAVLLLGTSADDATAVSDQIGDTSVLYDLGANHKVATTDINGDGLSDILVAMDTAPDAPTAAPYLDVFQGAATPSGFDPAFALSPPIVPDIDAVPNIAAPGDLDLDGYGDFVVGTKRSMLATYGSPNGLGVISIISIVGDNPPPDAGILPPPTAPLAVAGHDVDADGRPAFAGASLLEGSPFFFLRAVEGRFYDESGVSLSEQPLPTPATSFASGDFDGDGKADLAFATTVGGVAKVCFLAGSEVPDTAKLACWTPATVPESFATSLVAADLEGDGKDEILVSANTGGIDVLTVPGPGQLAAEHLAIEHGIRLTVMTPGRPGPAVWAATRADGASIAIFRNREQVRVIQPLRFFGDEVPTKFGLAIR